MASLTWLMGTENCTVEEVVIPMELMPTTSPYSFTSGPPTTPESKEASVWMKLICGVDRG